MLHDVRWKACLVKFACACVIFYSAFQISSNRIVQSSNQQDSTHNDMKIGSLAEGRNIELRKKETNLPHAFTFVDNKWKLTKLCKPYTFFVHNRDFPLSKYTSNAGTVKIFTHDPKKDGISSIINRTGAFEVNTINRILYELELDKQLNLIDIGTNVGQHCLAAALIGRDSIAIDAADANIEHVCASAHYLNVGRKITLIHNIISDNHEKHDFRYSKGGDYGSVHVDSDGIWEKMKKQYVGYFQKYTIPQNSVTLNDLLDLPQIHRFKKAFIKMDVEGHEHRVLLGAREFFKRIDVHGIVMEWAWHVKRPSANIIKSVMAEFKFKPFLMHQKSESPLKLEMSDNWPQDVLWLPIKYLH